MKLKLFWKDISEKKYMLGILSFEEHQYSFEINEEGLKEAIKHGCFGIGEFDLLKKTYISNSLFPFFKNRIPFENHIAIDEILEELDMKEYNEMELLKKTKGILNTDRYYLEE